VDLRRELESPLDPDAARRALRRYFVARGYALAAEEPLAWRRGTFLGSLLGQTPRRWSVRAEAAVAPRDGGAAVTVTLAVRATGQLVTRTERRFWEVEADGAAAAARGDEVEAGPAAEADHLEERARRDAARIMAWALGSATLLGLLGLALSLLRGWPELLPGILALAGAGLGALVGARRVRRRAAPAAPGGGADE